ncbi:thioredoxin-like protein [Lipomyces kononenkoae]
MFSAFNSARCVVTLFHSPTSSASRRTLQLLKKHIEGSSRKYFDLDVTEGPPTRDQLKTILNYTGEQKIGSIVPGAASLSDATLILQHGGADKLLHPIVVDWVNGKAVLGDDEIGLKQLVQNLEK